MWASSQEERRCAKNGKPYTYEEFVEFYGGKQGPAEWDRAWAPAWGRKLEEAANAGDGIELSAEENAGSAVELSAEDVVESLGALSEEARAMFRQLHKQVADEEQAGGPVTRFSILKHFLNMTTEELEKCIALYYRSQVSASGVPAAPEPQEQKVVGFDGSLLGSHGYPLRPNAETCAVFEKSGQCEYGEECRYDHPEEILAELLQSQAMIPPPPPPDEEEEEALILDDSSSNAESQAEETPPPTENAADSQAVYCEDCEMWLNGPTQWEDHKIGEKNTRRTSNGARAQRPPPMRSNLPKPKHSQKR
jgi:hypothetical protein